MLSTMFNGASPSEFLLVPAMEAAVLAIKRQGREILSLTGGAISGNLISMGKSET
jgi:hypothetical protein